MKRCPKCKITKSEDCFGQNKSRKDGRQVNCKPCRKLINNQQYRDNPNRRKRIVCNSEKYKARNKTYVDNLKERGCSKCEEVELCTLDFHHLDEDTKVANISKLVHRGSFDKLLRELNKCVLLCANCHRKVHAGVLKINA